MIGKNNITSRRDFLRTVVVGAVLASGGSMLFGCGRSLQEGLSVEPARARSDEVFVVRLGGLSPGERVTLSAAFDDAFDREWSSVATFEADEEGVVDTSRHAPVEGSYDIRDPTGLVWSALGAGDLYAPPFRESVLRLRARVGDAEATTSVRRYTLAEGVRGRDVRESGLVGRLFSPAGDGRAPGVLVFGGSEGGLATYVEREAALLASMGYAAFALAYFRGEDWEPEGADALPETLTNVPLEYFGRAMEWLDERGGADRERLGVLGHSRGGELALLLGATYSRIKAVVSYVGGGFVAPSAEGDEPAWTYRGEPLPRLPFVEDSSSLTREELERAEIPVARINGPTLLVGAGDDAMWPSGMLSEIAYEKLRRGDRPYEDELAVYPEAGHSITAPHIPTRGTVPRYGGTTEANAAANADAWRKTIAFLERNLRS